MSNRLDAYQGQHSVGTDLGPNCLQRSSADDKLTASNERVDLNIFSLYTSCIEQHIKTYNRMTVYKWDSEKSESVSHKERVEYKLFSGA